MKEDLFNGNESTNSSFDKHVNKHHLGQSLNNMFKDARDSLNVKNENAQDLLKDEDEVIEEIAENIDELKHDIDSDIEQPLDDIFKKVEASLLDEENKIIEDIPHILNVNNYIDDDDYVDNYVERNTKEHIDTPDEINKKYDEYIKNNSIKNSLNNMFSNAKTELSEKQSHNEPQYYVKESHNEPQYYVKESQDCVEESHNEPQHYVKESQDYVKELYNPILSPMDDRLLNTADAYVDKEEKVLPKINVDIDSIATRLLENNEFMGKVKYTPAPYGGGGIGKSEVQNMIDAQTTDIQKLDDIGDVNVSAANDGEVLYWNANDAEWNSKPVSAAGGGGSTAAIDSAASSDYIGASASNGLLRTTEELTYADGGDFITIGIDQSKISASNINNDIEWITSASLSDYALSSDVETNTTNISTVSADVITNATNIGTVSADTITNTTNIGTVSADVITVSADVITNTTNIGTVSADIITNTTNIGTISADVIINTVNISAVSADISTVSADVITNTTNIGTVSADVIINTINISAVSADSALKSNVLELDNTTSYTPTLSYHPVTKLYADSLSGGSGGSGVNGTTFIYGLSPDTGNIDITYAENNTRVNSASSSPDVTQITVSAFAYTGNTNVRPNVSANNQELTWVTSPNQNPTAYYGSTTLTMNNGTIEVIHEDGATHTVEISSDSAPVISSATFTAGYPGSQSQVKENDTFDIRVQSDINFETIEVEDSGACKLQSINGLDTNDYTFSSNVADRGTSTQALPARVRVKKSTGTYSDWVYTNVGSTTVDGTNLINLNNLYPSVGTMSQGSITYPGTQEAIKDTETVTVNSTCTDFDTILYSSPTSELTIPSTTTYELNKAGVQRNSGTYNISSNNYRIVANRTANDATTTKNLVVYIAHDDPTITMTEATYLRSGGNDGSSIQNHTITLTSNQNLQSAPTISAPPANAGTWSGVFTGGPAVWTRTLQVSDDDVKGAYAYQTLNAVNLAEKVVTTYTGDSNYTLRGFVTRNITLDAFANEVNMNVEAITYANVTMTWSAKSLPNKRAVGTTAVPDAGSWCLHTLSTNPTIIRILDTAATGSQSQASTITIEEVV